MRRVVATVPFITYYILTPNGCEAYTQTRNIYDDDMFWCLHHQAYESYLDVEAHKDWKREEWCR